MSMSPRESSSKQPARKRPVLSLVLALLIVLAGVVQLLATAHTYAVNVGELNTLKAQEAALSEKKEDIENDIQRWNDKAYVISQARERLGFVFPGETSVMVLNSDGVTGSSDASGSAGSSDDSAKDVAGDKGDASSSSSGESGEDSQALPWYKELQYSFDQADEQQNVTGDKFQNGSL